VTRVDAASYVISTTDYEGEPIVLTDRCYQTHVSGWGDSDKDTRLRLVPQLCKVIQCPRMVIPDPGHTGRRRYIDLMSDPGISDHLLAVVVVVDCSVTPREIVTWMSKRSLSVVSEQLNHPRAVHGEITPQPSLYLFPYA